MHKVYLNTVGNRLGKCFKKSPTLIWVLKSSAHPASGRRTKKDTTPDKIRIRPI